MRYEKPSKPRPFLNAEGQNYSLAISVNSPLHRKIKIKVEVVGGYSPCRRKGRRADLKANLKLTGSKRDDPDRGGGRLLRSQDNLTECSQPQRSIIRRWFEHAKNAMTGAILGYEISEAAQKLWSRVAR